jgi:hypothetical protein
MSDQNFTLTHVKVPVGDGLGWQQFAAEKAQSGANFYLEGADFVLDSNFCEALKVAYGYTVTWENRDHGESKAVFTKVSPSRVNVIDPEEPPRFSE